MFVVAVAACPPLALLLAVELLNRALKRHRAETGETTARRPRWRVSRWSRMRPCPPAEPTAEQRMWAYYVTERAKGRTPTGAELDRIAGTNNYGRKVLCRWRPAGPAARPRWPTRPW